MIATALRVKRKRTEDPVTALYFDDTRTSLSARKKVRVDNVVYRLSQTVDRPDAAIVNPPTLQETPSSAAPAPLQATPTALPRDVVLERAPLNLPANSSTRSSISGSSNSRVFRLARPTVSGGSSTEKSFQQQDKQQDVDMLSPEIASMLETCLNDTSGPGNAPPQHRHRLPSERARKLHQDAQQQPATGPVAQPDSEAEDYVYDIYYRYQLPTSSSIPGAPQASGEGLIGLIRFESDDEKLLGVDDDGDDSDVMATDDEDSNAEDYYKNDYPDEESDGAGDDQDYRFGKASRGENSDSDVAYDYAHLAYDDDDNEDPYNDDGYEHDYGGDLEDEDMDTAYAGRPGTTRRKNYRRAHVRGVGGITPGVSGPNGPENEDGFDEDEVVEGLGYLGLGAGSAGEEGETMEQYRDRIFEQLQREIDRRGEQAEDRLHD